MTDPIEISIELRDFCAGVSTQVGRGVIIAVLYENETDNEEHWRYVNCSAPADIKSAVRFDGIIPYNYVFEKTQVIKINICFHTSDGDYVSNHTSALASAVFKVAELVSSFGMHLRIPLLPTHLCSLGAVLSMSARPPQTFTLGTCLVNAKLPDRSYQPIIAQFQGKNIERHELLWDESSVFFRVYRLGLNDNSTLIENESPNDEQDRILLYQSEAIQEHSHPEWKPFELDVQDIADDRNRLLEVKVLYHDMDGREASIGRFLTTYAKMKYGAGPNNVYEIVNEAKKKHEKHYKNSGTVELTEFTDVAFFSFLDYIVSGTQLHFEIGVDFSETMGCTDEEREHFDAALQLAIRAIGGILRDYSPSRLFAAFGTGARIPPLGDESQCFPLNFSPDPQCRGLDGVCEAYTRARYLVAPLETACYKALIEEIVKRAEESGTRGLHYHVAVIFTKGGPIDDLKESITALTAVASVPLSIFFVPIGFPACNHLVNKMVSKAKRHLSRPCIEFIDLSSLLNSETALTAAEKRSGIAASVLARVPSEMVEYMHANQISAKPPIQVCHSPVFTASSLIPVQPTGFAGERSVARHYQDRRRSDSQFLSPYRQSTRRCSDSQYLTVDTAHLLENVNRLHLSSSPERPKSANQTSRERRAERAAQRRGKRRRSACGRITVLS